MDTVTKIIIGALIAVFSACAAIIYIVTRDVAVALVFTGLATSGMTALAGISYGSRLSAPITGELLGAPATVILAQEAPSATPAPSVPPTTPPVNPSAN